MKSDVKRTSDDETMSIHGNHEADYYTIGVASSGYLSGLKRHEIVKLRNLLNILLIDIEAPCTNCGTVRGHTRSWSKK